ncbi:MAG: hypothetical protein JRH11_28650 [Deltaproteobacteria bacterium]|nr:hypothetical protein [Deltaproteobacteria bacterium]
MRATRTRSLAVPGLVGLFAAALATMGPAPVAQAHGRFPATGEVAFHPTDPNVILLRTTFGLLATDDGGGVFRWVCPAAIGARMTEDPHITIAADGGFVVGLFDGLSRGTGGGCDWDFPSTELTDRVVIDVTRGSDGTLYALTSDGAAPNGVHRSLDEGLSWTATNDAIDPILFETIRVAPSDPSQIYLTGAYPPTADTPRRPFVYHSADGGVTWDSVAFTDFRADDRNVYVLGVDPTDSGRIMVRVRGDFSDRVYVSEDSGQTFSERISVLGHPRGPPRRLPRAPGVRALRLRRQLRRRLRPRTLDRRRRHGHTDAPLRRCPWHGHVLRRRRDPRRLRGRPRRPHRGPRPRRRRRGPGWRRFGERRRDRGRGGRWRRRGHDDTGVHWMRLQHGGRESPRPGPGSRGSPHFVLCFRALRPPASPVTPLRGCLDRGPAPG